VRQAGGPQFPPVCDTGDHTGAFRTTGGHLRGVTTTPKAVPFRADPIWSALTDLISIVRVYIRDTQAAPGSYLATAFVSKLAITRGTNVLPPAGVGKYLVSRAHTAHAKAPRYYAGQNGGVAGTDNSQPHQQWYVLPWFPPCGEMRLLLSYQIWSDPFSQDLAVNRPHGLKPRRRRFPRICSRAPLVHSVF